LPAGQALLIRRNDAERFRRLTALDRKGLDVAVEPGAVYAATIDMIEGMQAANRERNVVVIDPLHRLTEEDFVDFTRPADEACRR
jgi:hypothetical protein